MNSDVDKWDADFSVLLFILGLLKSLSTYVEVDNWDADFNPIEVGIPNAEFNIKLVFLKSTMLADFSSCELDNRFVEFALKFILQIFDF